MKLCIASLVVCGVVTVLAIVMHEAALAATYGFLFGAIAVVGILQWGKR